MTSDIKVQQWKPEYGEKYGLGVPIPGYGNYRAVYPYLKKLGLLKKSSSVFSIGAGDGYLETILAKKHDMRIGYLDPTQSLSDMFMNYVRKEKIEDRLVEHHVKYFQDFKPRHRYDLVISVNSWYYIGLFPEMVKKALKLLNPGGTLCIVMARKGDADQRIIDFLRPDKTQSGMLRIEDLSAFLLQEKFRHEIIPVLRKVPITRFITKNGFTENGKGWVTYMGRTDFAKRSPQFLKKLHAMFQEAAVNGYLVRHWGAVLIRKF